MGRARGVSDAEKARLVKKTGKGFSTHDIATNLGHDTGIIRRYWKNLSPSKHRSDCGVLKRVTARKIWKIVLTNSSQTSKIIFKEAGLPETLIRI